MQVYKVYKLVTMKTCFGVSWSREFAMRIMADNRREAWEIIRGVHKLTGPVELIIDAHPHLES